MELTFDAVHKRRGDFTLQASGIFSPGVHLISGKVGAGKSTLAALSAGIMTPDRGAVVRKGVSSFTLSLQFPEWHVTGNTIGEEIRSWGLDTGGILTNVGMTGREDEDPLALSRGELKRLHLACICMRDWDLLILDEPFSGLDCRQKRELCRWIGEFRSGILLICTHESHFLPPVDYLWEIREGVLFALGRVPGALAAWSQAPPLLKSLLCQGISPRNITEEEVREAVWKIRG
ncbi:MAG: ATP-binding cassette domain-containing protein [Methanolinea sp.]|nr:ATP-binding cassette domain-containing protein [Methanolinea sp.]